MGHALLIEDMAEIVFGVTMALIGAVTVVQTAQIVCVYTQPSVSDIECGSAASLEAIVSTTEPGIKHQTSSSHHSVQSEESMNDFGCILSGSSVEDIRERMDSIAMSEHLQGIGTTFENVDTPEEHDLLADITEMIVETNSGSPVDEASEAQGDRNAVVELC